MDNPIRTTRRKMLGPGLPAIPAHKRLDRDFGHVINEIIA